MRKCSLRLLILLVLLYSVELGETPQTDTFNDQLMANMANWCSSPSDKMSETKRDSTSDDEDKMVDAVIFYSDANTDDALLFQSKVLNKAEFNFVSCKVETHAELFPCACTPDHRSEWLSRHAVQCWFLITPEFLDDHRSMFYLDRALLRLMDESSEKCRNLSLVPIVVGERVYKLPASLKKYKLRSYSPETIAELVESFQTVEHCRRKTDLIMTYEVGLSDVPLVMTPLTDYGSGSLPPSKKGSCHAAPLRPSFSASL